MDKAALPKRARKKAIAYSPVPKLRAYIHPAEEGGFWAEVPALRGCYTQGETLLETIDNLQDAISGWLEVAELTHPPEKDAKAIVMEFPL